MGFFARRAGRFLFVLTTWCAAGAHAAPSLRVAAAADLASCIDRLNARFAEGATGAAVDYSIGSSGSLSAQIANGAPFDVFLSADTGYPRKLAAAGDADPDSLVVYALGTLTMIGAPDLPLAQGIKLLSTPAVRRIAIANPDVAPYGRAARAALQAAGVWDALQPKLVIGENVAQVAQFVRSGNVQIGFVGASHVEAGKRSWPVTSSLYPPIEQAGVVTARGRANPLAARYLRFLAAPTGRQVLAQCGFRLPDAGR